REGGAAGRAPLPRRHVPDRAHPGDRTAWPARHDAHRLRLRRRQRGGLRARVPGAGARRLGRAQLRVGAGLARDVPDPRVRLRGAAAEMAAGDGARREDRLLRPDRARLRLEPGRDAHDRAARRRRRLRPPRDQALDHERLDRRRRRGVGQARRRRARLPGPAGHSRLLGDGHPRQVLAAGVGDERAGARGLRGSRGRDPARRARHEGAARDAVAGALRHHLGRDRRRDGVLRRGARLRPVARAVLQADRGLPARPGQARRHALGDHEGAARVAPAREPEGGGQDAAAAGVARQAEQRLVGARDRADGARHPRRQRRDRRVPVGAADVQPGVGLHLRGDARHPHAGHGPGHHGLRGVRFMRYLGVLALAACSSAKPFAPVELAQVEARRRVTDRLVDLAKKGDGAALHALGRMGGDRAVAVLKDVPPSVASIEGLWYAGAGAAEVAKAYRGDGSALDMAVVRALGRLATPAEMPVLEKALGSSDAAGPKAAGGAAGVAGRRKVACPDGRRTALARTRAVYGLAYAPQPAPVEWLASFNGAPDERALAMKALAVRGGDTSKGLADADVWVCVEAERGLAATPAGRAKLATWIITEWTSLGDTEERLASGPPPPVPPRPPPPA